MTLCVVRRNWCFSRTAKSVILGRKSDRFYQNSNRLFRKSVRTRQNLSYSGASDFVNRVYELSIFVTTFFFIEKCIVAGEFCSPVTMHLQTINFLQIVGILDRFFKFAVIVHISRNAGIHSLRVACDDFRI